MKLTPWQSFWKDIFLLILIIILFFGQKYIKPLIENSKINYGISAVVLLICGWISYTGIKHLPIIDFRAYAVGKNIPEGMKSAKELGLEPPKYEVLYTLKNKNSGETVQITDTEYTNDEKWYAEGTPWEFQSDLTESKMVSSGYEPSIHDFILDCDGEDMTEIYLEEPKVVFFITPFSEKVTPEEISQLNHLFDELTKQNIKVAALTNGDLENVKFPYCFVDQITLKTIIRNNPGIMVLEKGTVVAKFHDNPIPSTSEILSSFSN